MDLFGYSDAARESVVFRPGVRADAGEVRVTLEPAGTVAGRLLLPAGARGISLGVEGGFPRFPVRVEESGDFVVSGVPSGVFRFRATAVGDDADAEAVVDASAGGNVVLDLVRKP